MFSTCGQDLRSHLLIVILACSVIVYTAVFAYQRCYSDGYLAFYAIIIFIICFCCAMLVYDDALLWVGHQRGWRPDGRKAIFFLETLLFLRDWKGKKTSNSYWHTPILRLPKVSQAGERKRRFFSVFLFFLCVGFSAPVELETLIPKMAVWWRLRRRTLRLFLYSRGKT